MKHPHAKPVRCTLLAALLAFGFVLAASDAATATVCVSAPPQIAVERIRGQVFLFHGLRPREEAAVGLTVKAISDTGKVMRTAVTDCSGRFALGLVPPGFYRVRIDGFVPAFEFTVYVPAPGSILRSDEWLRVAMEVKFDGCPDQRVRSTPNGGAERTTCD